ncbi:hypothetical protein DVH24_013350 [Malus domestica]|uniref:Uncharacterized protein n=1 Tax=Malus domestica TaxID=3750 RepID=A0A498HJV5_MALDO|nr:hypothetical protein DVH24_013350 [Malus domestica]
MDLEEFREEMKKIMLAIADGLGSSPIQMVLEDDDHKEKEKKKIQSEPSSSPPPNLTPCQPQIHHSHPFSTSSSAPILHLLCTPIFLPTGSGWGEEDEDGVKRERKGRGRDELRKVGSKSSHTPLYSQEY